MTKEEILLTLGIQPYDIEDIEEAMEEYANQEKEKEAIAFRLWMDKKGYFAQWKNDIIGYIRQENQILFSSWQSLDTIYNIYKQQK